MQSGTIFAQLIFRRGCHRKVSIFGRTSGGAWTTHNEPGHEETMTVNPAIFGLLLLTFVLIVIVAILMVEKIWLWTKNRATRKRHPAGGDCVVRLVQTAIGKD